MSRAISQQKLDAETNYLIKFNSVSVESDASINLTKQAATTDQELAAYKSISELARDGISYRQTLLSIAGKKRLLQSSYKFWGLMFGQIINSSIVLTQVGLLLMGIQLMQILARSSVAAWDVLTARFQTITLDLPK